MLFLHQRPVAVGVPRVEALDAAAIALGHLLHDALPRHGREGVAVARALVGHIHAEHPQQAVGFARGQFAERAEEAAHVFIVLGFPAFINAVGEGAAQDGQDADIGAEDVLEEDHLELDGVLEGVAVILHVGRGPGGGCQPVDERDIRGGLAVGRDESLAGEAESLRRAEMRCAQDDEDAVLVRGLERAIGLAVGLPAAFRAHVGGGNAHEVRCAGCGGGGAVQVPVEGVSQGVGLGGVGRTCVRGLAARRFGEGAVAGLAHAFEHLVFEKAAFAQGVHELALDLAHIQPAGDAHQFRAQVQFRLQAVKALETRDQGRRHNDHGVRVAVRIANEEAGALGHRRRHELEGGPQPRQWLCQILW